MEIKLITLLGLIVVLSVIGVQLEKVIVCFQRTESAYRLTKGKFIPSNIDPRLCTHLMYVAFGVYEDGEIYSTDAWLDIDQKNIEHFMDLKRISPSLKVLAVVGGWSSGSTRFSAIANDPAKRSNFVSSSVNFLKNHSFDGLNLDWEYPNQRHSLPNDDKSNFVTLLRDLKAAFRGDNLLLTISAEATESKAKLSYNIPEISKHVDLINVMTDNLHGPWENTIGIVSPLYEGPFDVTPLAKEYNVHASISYWLRSGAPKEKLVLSVPFYGRSFTLADSSARTPGSLALGPGTAGPYTKEPGYIGYNELCEKMLSQNWTYVWEGTQKVPYVYRGNQWIGFDDPTSIKLKAEYALNNDLAGVMVWTIETDDFRGECGARYPLLYVLNEVFSRNIIQTTTVSPPEFACTEPGYFKSPNDCSRFYICGTDMIVQTHNCPLGLLFDSTSNTCNFPDEVTC